ncbi:3-oxoadipate enol-lactonase [Devosia sp.]|uniref:3-oxoadipate enol-lactonase n=1 Tax=Devosia sp. TaxID=1871048 RepID=UPI001A03BB88|nr:3-oxoadipate enol-lactonase [Devosia sp.]MBE0581849.1 3-oxoadipate enol-lactonase [Devosia sp.]
MAFARINDVVLHYRVEGSESAPALVLANSLGTDARIWDAVVTLLAGRYRIISYDKRGHGLSDAPDGDYRLDDHVDDLAGLLRHLEIERLALAGVSVGGMIAQGFALRHPDRLAALVLCDTAAKVGDATMWNERIAAVRERGLEAIAEPVMARWFTERFRQEQADELAGWRNMLVRMPVDGYAGTCAALRDADLRDAIAAIAVPTLVVVGEQDLSTPVELVRQTAQAIGGAQFATIADCGHIPSIEQPLALTALMTRFLNEVGYD